MSRIFSALLAALLGGAALLSTENASAALKVVATTSDLGAIVQAVGAERVAVDVLSPGNRDPHYLEAKPSYMVKLNRADLLVANGLSLEEGWLPTLIRGGRNPKLNPGQKGYLELGPLISPIEIPQEPVSRAQGDVHPEGNPHFTLDPIRLGQAAVAIGERLAQLDPPGADAHRSRAKAFQAQMEKRSSEWRQRIEKSGVRKIVTYHPSLNYLLDRIGVQSVAFLEPKPGVPPTSKHTLSVIETMKREGVKIVLVENYFDTKIADRVVRDVPGARVRSIGLAVGSAPGLETNEAVIEQIVRAITGEKEK